MKNKSLKLQLFFASIWLVFTASLALWWMVFAMRLISNSPHDFERHKHMLFLEGLTFLIMLIVGGCVLIYFILREHDHREQLKNLFSGFTHDLKTRLAGMKLQTEIMASEVQEEKQREFINRLLTDTSRLQVQLENSLIMGERSSLSFYNEKIRLKEFFEMISDSWPNLKLIVSGDAVIWADRKAFEVIIANFLHNAITHGQATSINIHVASKGLAVQIELHDNGKGFRGEHKRLGEKLYRHNRSSGTGVGLFTAREFLTRMGGRIHFISDCVTGFVVQIQLPALQAEVTL